MAGKGTELYVDDVGVSGDYLRQGLARRMMSEMFKWGIEQGCQKAWIATKPDNVAARGLYESLAPSKSGDCIFYTFRLAEQ